jgi:hypothetical protein
MATSITCLACSKTYRSKQGYDKHIELKRCRIHDCSLECGRCNKTFSNKYHRKTHEIKCSHINNHRLLKILEEKIEKIQLFIHRRQETPICINSIKIKCNHGKDKKYCKICGGSQLCKSTFCETCKNKKYNGYCVRCYIHLFPDVPISRNYKTKEYAVLEFIKENYPEHTWINDKVIDGGCSKKRPDIFLDLLTHSIIIEIDEYQHRDYDNCELTRINLLFEDLGDRHIVFIRFNPDDYLDKDNNKITSCWGIDKNGLTCVKKSKKDEWEYRLNTLKVKVDEMMTIDNIDISNPITTINIFYDIIL